MDKNELENMEKLLKPQCEFRVSEQMRDRVMAEARKQLEPRQSKLWPWIAAACAVVVTLGLIIIPNDNEEISQNPISKVEKCVHTIPEVRETATKTEVEETTGTVAEETLKTMDFGSKKAKGTKKPLPKDSVKETKESVETTGLLAETMAEHADKDTLEELSYNNKDIAHALPPQPKVLNETDFPVTRPENLKYTPEEVARLKEQAKEAYINWMKLELEIIKMEQKHTAQMMKELK